MKDTIEFYTNHITAYLILIPSSYSLWKCL